MQDCILQADSLYFTYDGRTPALDGTSLSVRKGERIAVLGCNGAGKSTFFLCLNGVLKPEKGAVALHGKTVGERELGLLREHVGIVFQNADDQIIASTVSAEVSFGPMNLRLPVDEVQRRVDEALAYMELEEYRFRPPHYLSGGEKKRVSIADILAMHSEIILFDEPSTSLDPAGADMLEDVLRRLSEGGKTLLISTHDMDFAFRWATRAVVFCQGKIIKDSTPLEVFQDAETLRCAHLKQPVMLSVFRTLCETGVLSPDVSCPCTPDELGALLR